MNTDMLIREIVFASSDPGIAYAETDGYLLYRSDDAGVTWRWSSTSGKMCSTHLERRARQGCPR